MPVRLELVGQKFGSLTVEAFGMMHNGGSYWHCLCDCGMGSLVKGAKLRNGHTKSCGCLSSKTTAARNTTHSLSHITEYKVWQFMKDRCSNPHNKSYHNYGGRGIAVCEQWGYFSNFIIDMGPKPFPKAEIDRIDNEGNYEPGNCRWVTHKENCNNTRKTEKSKSKSRLEAV